MTINVNWQEHIKRFNELNESEGLTIKQYAEHYGLNYNTARRYLNAKPITDQGAETISDHDRPPAQRTGHNKASAPKRRTQPRTARNPRGKATNAAARTKATAAGGDENMQGSDNVITLASAKPQRDKGKPRKGEIDQSWKKGATAMLDKAKAKAEEDPQPTIRRLRTGITQRLDIYDVDQAVKEILNDDFFANLNADLLITAVARKNLLERTMKVATEELAIMIDCYNGVITPDDPLYVELGKDPKHPIFTHGKAISDAHYAMSDALRTIAQLSQGARKVSGEDKKARAELEASQTLTRIYSQLSDNTISPLDAVMQLEAQGLKPPAFLLQLANKELTEEPPVDPNAGVTDQAQLDREARAYAEMKAGKEAFLEERRKQVADIVDRGGYGDIDENGQRREGEGLDEYDDEEFDETTLQQQYKEDGADEWEDD